MLHITASHVVDLLSQLFTNGGPLGVNRTVHDYRRQRTTGKF